MLHKGMEAPVGYFQMLPQENRCVPHAIYLKGNVGLSLLSVWKPPSGYLTGRETPVWELWAQRPVPASKLVSATLSCATSYRIYPNDKKQ